MVKPSILHYIAGENPCGFWRLIWPGMIMSMRGSANISSISTYVRDFSFYSGIKLIRLQRQGMPFQLEFFEKLASMKEKLGFKLSYEIDDIPFYEDIPRYNSQYENYAKDDLRLSTQKVIELCDNMTVTTQAMKEYFLEKTSQKNIEVIPNYIPHVWMGNLYSESLIAHNYERYQQRPRILYMGSASHIDIKERGFEDDFSHVKDEILRTRHEFKWVFLGVAPLEFIPYIHAGDMEFHEWQNMLTFPKYLAKLNTNLWIAPLQDNTFNRCKSNIKYLEASNECFKTF